MSSVHALLGGGTHPHPPYALAVTTAAHQGG
jgi:hypothetical protein